MSYFTGVVYSDVLKLDTQIGVILPQDGRLHRLGGRKPGIEAHRTPKTLILLHGISDSASIWSRRTAVERYAELYDLAVIMPECQRSFYLNMENGYDFFTYITEELPFLAGELFHVSTRSEDLLLAGLSMGGYGAMHCALAYPERYAMVGSFSGAVDIKEVFTSPDFSEVVLPSDKRAIFSGNPVPDACDLFQLAKEAASGPASKLPLFLTCGTEDPLYAANLRFQAHLNDLNYHMAFSAWPGEHQWDFWDASLKAMLEHYFGL